MNFFTYTILSLAAILVESSVLNNLYPAFVSQSSNPVPEEGLGMNMEAKQNWGNMKIGGKQDNFVSQKDHGDALFQKTQKGAPMASRKWNIITPNPSRKEKKRPGRKGRSCPEKTFTCFSQELDKDLPYDNPGDSICWLCHEGSCVCSKTGKGNFCPRYMIDLRRCKKPDSKI